MIYIIIFIKGRIAITNINGYTYKEDWNNLSYIEPHKIIIKDTTFLGFNYSNEIYIKN